MSRFTKFAEYLPGTDTKASLFCIKDAFDSHYHIKILQYGSLQSLITLTDKPVSGYATSFGFIIVTDEHSIYITFDRKASHWISRHSSTRPQPIAIEQTIPTEQTAPTEQLTSTEQAVPTEQSTSSKQPIIDERHISPDIRQIVETNHNAQKSPSHRHSFCYLYPTSTPRRLLFHSHLIRRAPSIVGGQMSRAPTGTHTTPNTRGHPPLVAADHMWRRNCT